MRDVVDKRNEDEERVQHYIMNPEMTDGQKSTWDPHPEREAE
jgi:hypothetical protein